MILVNGVPVLSSSSTSSEDTRVLFTLLEHPDMVSAAENFQAIAPRKVSDSGEFDGDGSRPRKYVYVFQGEYATVDPAHVDFVGTDEATTCVGLALRNPRNGRISVAHMDSPSVVDIGLYQMLSQLDSDNTADASEFDVHMVGGYEDVPFKQGNQGTKSKLDGYSLPLCIKLINSLRKSPSKFHIRTLCILRHNTRKYADSDPCPIVNGILVDTSSGSVAPASFDRSTRCPDTIVRAIRVSASYEDSSWEGKLLETYDTESDRFVIAPCKWTTQKVKISMMLQDLPDSEILSICSTSPSAEGPDFVDTLRRKWNYMVTHPDWRETFPKKKPRIFERTPWGGWVRCVEQ